eukprot:706600-Amphidinium_carterae.1
MFGVWVFATQTLKFKKLQVAKTAFLDGGCVEVFLRNLCAGFLGVLWEHGPLALQGQLWVSKRTVKSTQRKQTESQNDILTKHLGTFKKNGRPMKVRRDLFVNCWASLLVANENNY